MLIVSTTIAFLFMETNSIENKFVLANVQSKVMESFDGTTKSNVYIINEGSADAYVRAYVVVYWMNDNNKIYPIKPVLNTDYTLVYDDSKWQLATNEYWYYPEILSQNEESTILIKEAKCISNNIPDGYHLTIEILSSAIQAKPEEVVEEHWNVNVTNDILSVN